MQSYLMVSDDSIKYAPILIWTEDLHVVSKVHYGDTKLGRGNSANGF